MREKLIELLWQWGVQQYIPFHTEIAMLADYLIANGVTVSDTNVGKLVLCKDCVHWDNSDQKSHLQYGGTCWKCMLKTNKDHFCAYAEQR